ILLLFWDRGWPVARIHFAALQPHAEQIARQFLAEAGVDLAGFDVVVSFETDRSAQNYLERVAGQRALDRIAADDVTVWRWRARFFRELDAREYAVGVLPSGRVSGWSQILAEADPGATLSEPEARALAERAVAAWTRAGETWRPAGYSAQTLPNRVDYRFTYERDDWSVGDATHRRVVTVHGDQIGGVVDFLHVPDAWIRAQRIETNRGVVLAVAGWTITVGIGLAAIAVALWAWTTRQLPWRAAVAVSVALLLVSLLALANQLPVWLAGYTTTVSVSAHLAGLARDQIGQLGPTIAVAGVAVAAALAIWRRALPTQPHPIDDLRVRALATQRFARAVIVGYAAAGAWLGYFTLYYWVGASVFGVWSPLELPYRDVMSGAFPAAFPLFVALAAALAEESVFRLFALPAGILALGAIWRRAGGASPGPRAMVAIRLIVIVAVAAVWGSLHSTYPQQPFFIRALELTITGVLAGFVFLRWGIVAVTLTHYIGNASVAGALFLLSGNLGLQVAAVVVILLPTLLLLPALVSWLRGRPLPERHVAAEPVGAPPITR
ncbi:MAG: CPBP family glutamic-type intramembrane protease, partial [Dehalococcoidia bacterium]|nr:CPBP family glutamic-type intramembrane protease [Dehalococcoidia bacterium]